MRARQSKADGIDVRETPAGIRGFLERNNVLYPASALLMLVGCFLISMPYLFEYRELGGLMVLLGVINVYEAMVIATFAFVMRRTTAHLPTPKDAPMLLFVQLLFLMDASFTVNACISLRVGWGTLIAVASLALALAKVYALERGSGTRVFRGVKAVLLPVMVFTYTFQSVLAFYRSAEPAARESSTYFVWFVFGALPLTLMLARFGRDDADGEEDVPAWIGPAFRKAVAGVALALVTAQLLGQVWVHRTPFAVGFLLPLIFSVIALAKTTGGEAARRSRDRFRIAAAAFAVFIVLAVHSEMLWAAPLLGEAVAFSPTRIGLVFGATVFMLVWRRERSGAFYSAAFVLLGFALLGHSGESIAWELLHPGPARALVVATLAALWFLPSRTYARAIVAMTPVLFMTCMAVGQRFPEVDPGAEFLRYWPLGAFGIALALGSSAKRSRAVLAALLFAIALLGLDAMDGASVVYLLAVLAAFAGAIAVEGRRYVYVTAGFLTAADLRLYGLTAPQTAVQWGALAIVTAFMLFAAGLLVTRFRLLRPAGEKEAGEGEVDTGGAT
jgi:hypothetical protein